MLINATGAWVDEVNAMFHMPSSYTIEKLSGIHLVIDKVLVPEPLILETSSNLLDHFALYSLSFLLLFAKINIRLISAPKKTML